MPERRPIGTTACAGILTLLLAAPAFAQKKLDPLQYSLGDLEVNSAWIYNDLAAGLAKAKATGKPLLVVFRCVP